MNEIIAVLCIFIIVIMSIGTPYMISYCLTKINEFTDHSGFQRDSGIYQDPESFDILTDYSESKNELNDYNTL